MEFGIASRKLKKILKSNYDNFKRNFDFSLFLSVEDLGHFSASWAHRSARPVCISTLNSIL